MQVSEARALIVPLLVLGFMPFVAMFRLLRVLASLNYTAQTPCTHLVILHEHNPLLLFKLFKQSSPRDGEF